VGWCNGASGMVGWWDDAMVGQWDGAMVGMRNCNGILSLWQGQLGKCCTQQKHTENIINEKSNNYVIQHVHKQSTVTIAIETVESCDVTVFLKRTVTMEYSMRKYMQNQPFPLL
jgi:hypothetical protein